MLTGLHPLLTGDLLAPLDRMGHSDAVVIADANFPADRIGARVVDLPGTTSPEVLVAVLSVLPLDEDHPVQLMDSGRADAPLPVQQDLIAAVGLAEAVAYVARHAFYEAAAEAYLIVRTGESRPFGNALVRKGVVAVAS